MLPKTIEVKIEVPDEVSEKGLKAAEAKAKEAAVISLWEQGELSTRQAAAVLGMTYRAYLDLLAERGIPIVQGQSSEANLKEALRQVRSDKVGSP